MRKVKNKNNNLDKSIAKIKSTQWKDKKCREEEDKQKTYTGSTTTVFTSSPQATTGSRDFQ